jgi:hypothetical protein
MFILLQTVDWSDNRTPRTSDLRGSTTHTIRRRRRSTPTALTAFLLVVLFAQFALGASFSTSLDRDTISVGESATLTLSFQDGAPTHLPTIPAIPNLRIEDTGSESINTVIVNGNLTTTRSHTFAVIPSQMGKFTIPPLSVEIGGQTLTSQPIVLTVGKTGAVSTNTAFLKLIIPKNQVYIGEILPLEIQLYYQAIRGGEAPHIKEEGFTLGKMIQGGESATVLNGRQYNILPLKTYVIPVKIGTIDIGPATMDLQVMRPNSRVDFFGRPVDFQAATIQSQPETLQILPLPKENVPPTFNGAVGAFSLVVSASPTNVAVGDPITVKVQIAGTGALDSVTLPTQEGWQQFKLYPPTSEFQPGDPSGISGTKTFSLTAVPQNLDIKELPPFSFSFFDPNQRTYRTVTQPAVPLIVRPSAASLPPPVLTANPPGENQSTNTDLATIKVRLGDVRPIRPPLAVQPWFLGVQAIPVFAWLALLFQRRRKEHLDKNPRLRRELAVAQTVRNGLRQLRQHANANEPAEFFSTLFHLLQEQLGERLNMPASAITESIVDERLRPLRVDNHTLALLAELFHACNQARYAPTSTNEELVSLIPKTETALNELKKIKA